MRHYISIYALLSGIAMGLVPAMADTRIKIGILSDMSGPYSDLAGPGSVAAARLAVEDFKGKDKGIEVEIVSGNHQNKADIGSVIARSWIDQEGVDVIGDVTGSPVALAVSQIVKDKDKIQLNAGAATADLTGSKCTPNTIHWTYDTWANANGTGSAMVRQGGNSWFFIAVDQASGHAMERDTVAVVKAAGGQVLGSVKHPLGTSDFSSYLVRAQSSGAKVVGLASGGEDMINAIKQASEFGIVQGGQSIAGLFTFITDIHALGLKLAQGLVLTEAFYWDRDDASRAFAKRFAAVHKGKMPTQVHAGVYSSIMHYLKAVEAAGTKDTNTVLAKMRAMPIDDPLFGKGEVRIDGRAVHDMFLFRVKTPAQSKGEWDVYETLATIPAAQAFRPLNEGGCPLVK
ncbi:branched-chain amino acid transport system substrate-binding protein [Xanthobacter sp. SG618]|uniref:ABC transporter substrate-binding protein n=1 Tax=Xanthobacter sp. SG618 TaxID=2587121 RepID=UPI00145E9A10|nr:ABC transporter substrate-binding protein [Xanthobacter sp. SG618]NMN58893.1 branched-chain amino acid transport system substrate-binding protein [Xanthobacter sp. SG618]